MQFLRGPRRAATTFTFRRWKGYFQGERTYSTSGLAMVTESQFALPRNRLRRLVFFQVEQQPPHGSLPDMYQISSWQISSERVACGAPNSATLVHATDAPRISVWPALATNVPEEPWAQPGSVVASRWQNQSNCSHLSSCACHPCAVAMLIFIVFMGGRGPTISHLLYDGGNEICRANTLQHLRSSDGCRVPILHYHAIVCRGCLPGG